MNPTATTAIWWIRRDLRLFDNTALTAALEAAEAVVPLFILDPTLLNSPYVGDKRLGFLFAALRDLDAALRRRGSRLIIRRGDPAAVLRAVVDETRASAVWAEGDASTYALKRDARVAAAVPLAFAGSTAIRPPGTVLKPDGDPYTVFTPFSKAWLAQSPPQPGDLYPTPERIPTPADLPSEAVPEHPPLPDSPFAATEAEAQRRLAAFVADGITTYGALRNRMDLDGTSQLSPYLRFGLLSSRQAAVAAIAARAAAHDDTARAGATTWLNELIWREFYIHILYHFPHVAETSFRPTLRDIPWRNDPDEFEAWCAGQTGYPVVDAAMRQLRTSGWMPNRARMIVASFLVKDLLIDWRWGERWFMQHLVDGDPAANNGGWQWTAGTGTDAAPYFRIFNPITQGYKFDPDGEYVRRWVPELAGVVGAAVHEPGQLTPLEQRAAGVVIGQDYPFPIVDHRIARDRTLAAFAAAKETGE
jgi:deoxyribodipyrimidine photo-lyase